MLRKKKSEEEILHPVLYVLHFPTRLGNGVGEVGKVGANSGGRQAGRSW